MLKEQKKDGQVKVKLKLNMKVNTMTESRLKKYVQESIGRVLLEDDSYEREKLHEYIKSMISMFRGLEDFDSSHEIEIDFWNGPTKKKNITIQLTVEVPDTGNKEFDTKITKEYVKYLVSKLNEDNSSSYSFREKRPIDLVSVDIS